MSFDDLENIYYGIQEELQKADNFMSHAIAGTRVTEACDNGLKVLSVVDKEIVAFTSKAKAFQGEDGKKAQEYVAELRQKHQTLKTQFMKIRDEKMGQNAVVGLSAGQEQLLQLDDMKNQALNGLAQATDMTKDMNQELIRQNDKIDDLTEQNKRIAKNVTLANKLAELIRCTEEKHMYFQVGLLALCLVLTIVAICVKVVK